MRRRWIRSECHWIHRLAAFADVRNFAWRNVCHIEFLQSDAQWGNFLWGTFGRRLTCSVAALTTGCFPIGIPLLKITDNGVWWFKRLTTETVYYSGNGGCNRVPKLVVWLIPFRKRAPRQYCIINNNNVLGSLWVMQLIKTYGIRAGPFTGKLWLVKLWFK